MLGYFLSRGRFSCFLFLHEGLAIGVIVNSGFCRIRVLLPARRELLLHPELFLPLLHDLLQVALVGIRYILQNPMKAGMENCPGSWRWSSYLAYEKGNGSITDTEYAIGLFEGRDQLLNYVKLGNEDAVMDEERFDWRLRDERAKEIVERVSGCATVAEFQGLEKSRKKKYVRELYQENLTLGQITRLTGVPKTTVDRTVRGLHARPQAEPETPVLFEASDFEYDSGDVEIW